MDDDATRLDRIYNNIGAFINRETEGLDVTERCMVYLVIAKVLERIAENDIDDAIELER